MVRNGCTEAAGLQISADWGAGVGQALLETFSVVSNESLAYKKRSDVGGKSSNVGRFELRAAVGLSGERPGEES